MADKITPQTLRFERLLDAPIEKVWRYLVDPELRARWFMGGPVEYCGPRRALRRPTFLRSTSRASRVTKPA